ncbi:hypothetical protein D3C76_1789460 [compost metagenome]
MLEDIPALPQGTTALLPFLPAVCLQNCSLLVMFEHDMDRGRLAAQPLGIIHAEGITRLL